DTTPERKMRTRRTHRPCHTSLTRQRRKRASFAGASGLCGPEGKAAPSLARQACVGQKARRLLRWRVRLVWEGDYMMNEPGQVPRAQPLAYYLTWTTYGTWLPGDDRSWVDKPGQLRAPDAKRQEAARRLMTEPALTLDTEQRCLVEDTIADHCRIRG